MKTSAECGLGRGINRIRAYANNRPQRPDSGELQDMKCTIWMSKLPILEEKGIVFSKILIQSLNGISIKYLMR
jgi:hypothetical protein